MAIIGLSVCCPIRMAPAGQYFPYGLLFLNNWPLLAIIGLGIWCPLGIGPFYVFPYEGPLWYVVP